MTVHFAAPPKNCAGLEGDGFAAFYHSPKPGRSPNVAEPSRDARSWRTTRGAGAFLNASSEIRVRTDPSGRQPRRLKQAAHLERGTARAALNVPKERQEALYAAAAAGDGAAYRPRRPRLLQGQLAATLQP